MLVSDPYEVAARSIHGLPAVARFMVDDRVVMTPDIQHWMYDLCCEASGVADDKNSWRSLMANDRFITNYTGNWTHADYINGTLIDKGPMQLQPQGCGGTVLKIIGEGMVAGEECWKFEAINSLGNYRQYHPRTHWWLFFKPTNSVRREVLDAKGNWTGKYQENISDPFPQFREKSIVPIFGVGRRYNFIQKWRVRILGAAEPIPSPFYK